MAQGLSTSDRARRRCRSRRRRCYEASGQRKRIAAAERNLELAHQQVEKKAVGGSAPPAAHRRVRARGLWRRAAVGGKWGGADAGGPSRRRGSQHRPLYRSCRHLLSEGRAGGASGAAESRGC